MTADHGRRTEGQVRKIRDAERGESEGRKPLGSRIRARFAEIGLDDERRVECRTIVEALDRLPQEQRAVILLVALEGFSYDEVADVLKVPIGTVRSRLSRGRQSLRELRVAPLERPALRRVK
jgi:RNA polymerase sigma factor (sigma-70 family)